MHITTRRRRLLLIAIVVVAGAFRFWGLTWGLPDRPDLHPDESVHVVSNALRISLHDLDPSFLNYPGFMMYAIAVPYRLLMHAGLVHAPWQAHLIGRVVVALFGTATCAMIYLLADTCGAGALGALLAALWTALLPLHVWESHVAVTDVVMTFWIIVVLWASVRMLQDDRLRFALVAGAACGLAVGSKYTAALAGLAPLMAVLCRRGGVAWTLRRLCWIGVSALLFCFAVTPYSFIRLPDTLRAMVFEQIHVHWSHPGFSVPAAGPQYHRYIYQLVAAWPFSMGFPLYLCALAGGVWTVRHLCAPRAILLSFFALFFGVTGSWLFTPLRYYIPLVVLGALFAGCWLGAWSECAVFWKRHVARTLAVLVLIYTAAFTFQTTARFRDDTRLQAGRWLASHIPAGARIAICGDHRYMGQIADDPRFRSHCESFIGAIDQHPEVDLLEISSLHYLRWYRVHHPAYQPAYDHLRKGHSCFRFVKRFDAPFLNRSFYRRLDPMFTCYWISPTLEFYVRDDTATGKNLLAALSHPEHPPAVY